MAGDTTNQNQDKHKDGESSGGEITYSSPYYLHPSDYPKQLHVNEVLTDSNFADWNQEMTNFLFAKNKFEFVNGTIKRPDKTSKDYMPWMRVDAMIKGWLSTAMEKNIRDSVKYATTSSEIWADLNERFGKESAPRAYEIKQKISSTRQNGVSISKYFTQLRSLWDESQSIHPLPRCTCSNCECDIGKKINEHQEKDRLYEFLMGLDADFAVIRTQILATKPVVSLGTAYHLVAEDERQRIISGEGKIHQEPVAFKATQRRDQFPARNKGKDGVKTGEQCTECKKEGHTREECFELIGYPEWWPGKKKGKPKAKAALVDSELCPIPGLTKEDYQLLLKHFSDTGKAGSVKPMANMAGKEEETGGSPISWKTKKQSVVSRSSAEAEYRAMASTVSEILWVRWLLSELQIHISSATPLFCDNQAARHIANNPVFHERTKHVEMDCYFVRERVESKEVVPMKVSSKLQLADLLTKGLTAQQHQFLLGKIGMTDLHAPS